MYCCGDEGRAQTWIDLLEDTAEGGGRPKLIQIGECLLDDGWIHASLTQAFNEALQGR